MIPHTLFEDSPRSDYIVDVMSVIRCYRPEQNETLADFGIRVYDGILRNIPEACQSIHLVGDRYDGLSDDRTHDDYSFNLKEASGCRERRGDPRGNISSPFTSSSKVATLWDGILSSRSAKGRLLKVLFEVWEYKISTRLMVHLAGGFESRHRAVTVTPHGSSVDDDISSCHEEADTWVLYHTAVAARRKSTLVIILANNTDIVLLAAYYFQYLASLGLKQLWVKFPSYCIPIHTAAQKLGVTFCNALPLVHSLSGCDTTSFLYGIGKVRFFRAAKSSETLLGSLGDEVRALAEKPSSAQSDGLVNVCKQLVVTVYGRSATNFNSLNDLRAHLYSRLEDLRRLPPTDISFLLHLKRCIFQSLIWIQSHKPCIDLPQATDMGWRIEDHELKPDLVSAMPHGLASLSFCNCDKTKCGSHCKCSKIGFCDSACKCGADPQKCLLSDVNQNESEDEDEEEKEI